MKYSFVTGASRGIGREVAKIFAQKVAELAEDSTLNGTILDVRK